MFRFVLLFCVPKEERFFTKSYCSLLSNSRCCSPHLLCFLIFSILSKPVGGHLGTGELRRSEIFPLVWMYSRIGKDHILQKRGEMRLYSFLVSNSETCRRDPPARRRAPYQDAILTAWIEVTHWELLRWRVVSICNTICG